MKTTSRFTMLSSVLMLVLSACSAHAASESLYPDTVAPAARSNDAFYELGTIFRAELAGRITHVRVFSLAEESGDHQVRIWRNTDNTLVAGPIAWTFGGEEAWITLDIPDVSIQAGQDYTISISTTPENWYPANGEYFLNAGSNGQNLGYPQGAGVFSVTAGTRPTNTFNNAAYLRDIVFEPDLSGTIMRVKGMGLNIVDGATNPALANGTDLGGKGLNAGSREQTFTIENIGQTALQLTGNPAVAISGAQAADFTVTTQPAATVPGGGSTTFTVRFDPSAIGIRKAAIAIAHPDSPTNPYDFAIQGAGLGGGAGVIGNDSDGSFSRNIGPAQIHGNRFAAPVAMRITELHARVLELVGTFKCAVYSDTNGLADRLLRSSVEVVNPTNGWNTFALTAPLDLAGGDFYWLVIWADTAGALVVADTFGTYSLGSYSYLDLAGEFPDPISLTVGGGGDAPARTYCIYADGTPLGTAPGPEMDLRGNGKLIVSGDISPSSLDGSHFGSLNLGSGFQDRTFTIQNVGDAPLALAGTPRVSITGPESGDFIVTSPPASPVARGGTATFTVRFDPSARGVRTATISVANDDLNENPYTFTVQGGGVAAGRESIFPDTKVLGDIGFDDTYYELGTVFHASVPGKVTHLRVYSLASESGDHTARLWRNSDNAVIGGPYIWNYGGVTGWIELDIPDVDIEADTDYTVSISTEPSENAINYPNLSDLAAGGNNGLHLFYPVDAGKFTETRGAQPTSSFNHGDYGRDILFVPSATAPESIFPDTKVLGDIGFDDTYYELGTVFHASVPGKVTHLRVYSLASESGDHTARLWRNSDNTVIAGPYTWNYGGVTGWIEFDIPDVDIEADTDYTVSISTEPSENAINYPNQSDLAVGGNNGLHLFYPVDAGKFTETRGAQPTSSFNHGDYGRDIVFVPGAGAAAQLRIVEIKPDLATGNITLRWEGGTGPQFQVEKATTVTGPFQAVSVAGSARTFTDPGALKSRAQSFYRVRQGSEGFPPPCITTPAPATWVNTPFATQTGIFTVEFDATPSAAPRDYVMALSSGPANAFNGFAVLVRFSDAGKIDARNAGAYAPLPADNVISYSASVQYHFRLVVNIPAHTYSIYVTPAGGVEQTVGTNFAFRTEQNTVTKLDNWGAIVGAFAGGPAGFNTVCNFKIVPALP